MNKTNEMVPADSQQPQLIADTVPEAIASWLRLSSLPADTELLSPAPSAAFIESVRRMGVLQPIIVEFASVEEGTYLVRAGRRRIKAARAAALEQIPAMIFNWGTFVNGTVELVENQQRSDNPISDLAAIEELLSAGSSEQHICQQLGMNRLTLQKRMLLRRLVPEMRDAVVSGKMKCSTAEIVATLPAEKQMDILRSTGGKWIKHKDVKAIKMTRAAEAFTNLPAVLFDPLPDVDQASPARVNPLDGLPDGPQRQGVCPGCGHSCAGGGDPSITETQLWNELTLWRSEVDKGPLRPVKTAILAKIDGLMAILESDTNEAQTEPAPPAEPEKSKVPCQHLAWHEVGEQRDNWPAGDLVTLECNDCGHQWEAELLQ